MKKINKKIVQIIKKLGKHDINKIGYITYLKYKNYCHIYYELWYHLTDTDLTDFFEEETLNKFKIKAERMIQVYICAKKDKLLYYTSTPSNLNISVKEEK